MSQCRDRSAGALAGGRAGTLPAHPHPTPIPQIGFRRILNNVVDRAFKLTLIAKQVIVVFLLPEFSPSPNAAIRLLRGVRLPGMKDIRESMRGKDSDDHMHMIRHDEPRKQSVSLLFKLHQST